MAKDPEETVYAPRGAEDLEATRFEGGDSSPGLASTEPGITTDRVRARAPVEPSLRTSFAEEGLRLGIAFAHHFAGHALGVRKHLRVRLSDPGLSTDGGLKARQAITLVADTRARGSTVIGWLDGSRRAAALKPWERVASQHAQRFRAPPDLAREEYEALTAEIARLLEGHAITLEPDEPAATESSAERGARDGVGPAASGRMEWSITPRHIALFVGLVLAIGVVLGVTLAKSCGQDEPEPPRPHLRNPLERFKR